MAASVAKRTGFTATWRAFFARLGLAYDRAARGELAVDSRPGGFFTRPPLGGVYIFVACDEANDFALQSLVSTLRVL